MGDIDQRWYDLFNRSAGCSDAIVRGVNLGDPFSRVQEAADAFIAQSGVDRAKFEWFIGGYTLGIAFPPDWVHRHRPNPFEPANDPVMRPGMVFNFEVQYDVFEGWPGGSGAGWIDSYLMTEKGLEIPHSNAAHFVISAGLPPFRKPPSRKGARQYHATIGEIFHRFEGTQRCARSRS